MPINGILLALGQDRGGCPFLTSLRLAMPMFKYLYCNYILYDFELFYSILCASTGWWGVNMGISMGGNKTVNEYDVLVYQTSNYTRAVDSSGRTISSIAISKQTDDVVIKAALTYINDLVTGYHRRQNPENW